VLSAVLTAVLAMAVGLKVPRRRQWVQRFVSEESYLRSLPE
jgi:hypothetical protein